MKTIEEAAIQHCNRSQFKSDFPHDYHSEESGFKAGVEFAQRWIPVEEGLPDFLTDVLIKQSNGKISIGCLFIDEKFNVEFINEKIKVTHWRPIEYK